MRWIIVVNILAASFIAVGCDPAEQSPDPAGQAAAMAIAVPPKVFVPPGDSAVTERQFGLWKECGILLDSLTYFYADSFRTVDPVAMLRIQEDFIKAQDRICRRAGLAGREEYRWISTHVGLPKNRRFLNDG